MVPPKLRPGDTIAVFSPSSSVTATVPSRYLRGKAFLEAKGFRVVEGCLTGKQDGYRSGCIQERSKELNRLLRDPDVRCIMSAIGGYNSNALLSYIDYDAIRADPKIIIGYSDVTALLLGICVGANMVVARRLGSGDKATNAAGFCSVCMRPRISFRESCVRAAANCGSCTVWRV